MLPGDLIKVVFMVCLVTAFVVWLFGFSGTVCYRDCHPPICRTTSSESR